MSIIAQAKSAGFSKVQSAAGWIDLDNWQPYGEKPDANNYVRFVLNTSKKRIEEEAIRETYSTIQGFGLWPLK